MRMISFEDLQADFEAYVSSAQAGDPFLVTVNGVAKVKFERYQPPDPAPIALIP